MHGPRVLVRLELISLAMVGLLAGGCREARRAQSLPLHVERAFTIKAEIDRKNREDLGGLWASVSSRFRALPPERKSAFFETLAARLQAERAPMLEALEILKSKKLSMYYELESGLSKLAGTVDSRGKVLRRGVLDDCLLLLEPLANGQCEQLIGEAMGHDIAVWKTLLLYSHALLNTRDFQEELDTRDDSHAVKLSLVYEAPLPGVVNEAVSGRLLLLKSDEEGKTVMRLPNAGYVYGGAIVNGHLSGTDCSGFISYCLGSRVRMSTLYMDLVWREKKGWSWTYSSEETFLRNSFINKDEFAETLGDFDAISPNEPLVPGDIVTWRNLATGSGHTALVVSVVPGLHGEFMGLSAIRTDDYRLDGIEISPFRVVQAGRRTTVLRPR